MIIGTGKRTLVFVCVALSMFATMLHGASAQLTPETVERLRSSYKLNRHTRAMYNALTNTDVTDIALNREIIRDHNELYSHKIDAKGITNQKSSGRCWLFAGLNILRPMVIAKHKLKEFEFSQNYLAFYDKLEKANCFFERVIEFRDRDIMDRELELVLRKPIPDGGYRESVVNLVEKYGAVPKEIMPETNSSSSTGRMNRILARKLRSDAVVLRKMHQQHKPLEKLRQAKMKMLKETYKILAMNLGRPPTEFEWRYEDSNSVVSEAKQYTPQSFYKDFVAVDLSEYVDLFNDPSKAYDRHYRLSMSTNVHDGLDVHFANIRLETLKDVAAKSVLDNEPVWFACDVGKNQSSTHGIMAEDLYDYESVYATRIRMSKAERALCRESVHSHAMVFIGIDMADDAPVKWLVENSWGTERGSKGRWALYDDWFDRNVYSVIVKKKYVPERVLKILEQPAVDLPPWDPMFAFVR